MYVTCSSCGNEVSAWTAERRTEPEIHFVCPGCVEKEQTEENKN